VSYIRHDHQYPEVFAGFTGGGSDGEIVFNNTVPNSIAVVTCIDTIPTFYAAGAWYSLALDVPYTVFRQDDIGAGQHDSFAWRGMLPIHPSRSIVMFSSHTVGWMCLVSGFWVPEVKIPPF